MEITVVWSLLNVRPFQGKMWQWQTTRGRDVGIIQPAEKHSDKIGDGLVKVMCGWGEEETTDTRGACTHLQILFHGPPSPAHKNICGKSRRWVSAFLCVSGLRKGSGNCHEKSLKPHCIPSSENTALSLWRRSRKPCPPTTKVQNHCRQRKCQNKTDKTKSNQNQNHYP